MHADFKALEEVEFDASVDLWRAVGLGVAREASATDLDAVVTHMASRGARTAVTETGERQPDKPSNSYRNILRAGFHERYLRHNYLSPQAA